MIRVLLARIRAVKLSTAVMALFAIALVLPWIAYAWLLTAERANTIARTERELGTLAAAYAEHVATLTRLGVHVTPDGTGASGEGATEMTRFARALGRPDVHFGLRPAGLHAPSAKDTIAVTVDDATTGLAAEAAMPRDVALAQWQHEVAVATITVLLRTLVVLLVGLFLVTQLRWRERAENALAAAKHDAESASRAKSQFLANMSHELRTPLNAIIGFSEVIESGLWGPLNARYRDYAGDILSSGRHLLQLINQILDLSKLEAGQFELHEQEVDMARLVQDCMHLVEAQAAAAGIELHRVIPSNIPAVCADERRMRQIMLNLLSNAVKFTPSGGYVRVALARRDGGIAIEVSDTGIGMTEAEIVKALEPFGQIDSSLSRAHDGTGLGLPLARQLIELHGGMLVIRSESHVGTTVTATLPAARLLRKHTQVAHAV